jgi:hypothetical protein
MTDLGGDLRHARLKALDGLEVGALSALLYPQHGHSNCTYDEHYGEIDHVRPLLKLVSIGPCFECPPATRAGRALQGSRGGARNSLLGMIETDRPSIARFASPGTGV